MSTKTKTFEECCDEVAIENGFESHLDYLKESIIPLFKEAAELYATEKIKRAIELAREKEWISVKETLPQALLNVQVCIELAGSPFITRGYYANRQWRVMLWETSSIREVSHWQNLPSPPKDLNENK